MSWVLFGQLCALMAWGVLLVIGVHGSIVDKRREEWSNADTHRDRYRGTGLTGPATSPEAVPSRVLAREEPCADPASCDIHGHETELLSQWLRRQPAFVAGDAMPPRLRHPTAADFNSLKDDLNQPQLGLATTRQLLEELAARGRVGKLGCVAQKDHDHLEADAKHLLGCMAEVVLEYRTVNGE